MKHLFKAVIISLVVLPLLAACGNKNETKYLAVKLAGSSKWSIIDIKDGSLVAEDEFENAPTPIVNDRFFVKNKKGKFELYDINNINDPIESYDQATPFRDERAIVSPDGKKMEVIDTKGEVVKKLPGSYKLATEFMNGSAAVRNDNDKWGFINTDGEVAVKLEYDAFMPFSEDHYAIVAKTKNKDEDEDLSAGSLYNVSIINEENEKQFGFTMGNSDEAKYNDIMTVYFQNGSLGVKKDDKVVYLGKEGKELFEVGDDSDDHECYGIYKGLTVYADGDEYGIKNEDGEKVLRAKYNSLFPIKNGKFIAVKDDDRMIIDQDGEQITKDKYANIAIITEDRFLVRDKPNGKWYLIDEEGNQIGEEEFSDYVFAEPLWAYFEMTCDVDGSNDSEEDYDSAASALPDSTETSIEYDYSYDAAVPSIELVSSPSAPAEDIYIDYPDAAAPSRP